MIDLPWHSSVGTDKSHLPWVLIDLSLGAANDPHGSVGDAAGAGGAGLGGAGGSGAAGARGGHGGSRGGGGGRHGAGPVGLLSVDVALEAGAAASSVRGELHDDISSGINSNGFKQGSHLWVSISVPSLTIKMEVVSSPDIEGLTPGPNIDPGRNLEHPSAPGPVGVVVGVVGGLDDGQLSTVQLINSATGQGLVVLSVHGKVVTASSPVRSRDVLDVLGRRESLPGLRRRPDISWLVRDGDLLTQSRDSESTYEQLHSEGGVMLGVTLERCDVAFVIYHIRSFIRCHHYNMTI